MTLKDKAKDKAKANNQPHSDKSKKPARPINNNRKARTCAPTTEPWTGKCLITMLATDVLANILDFISSPQDLGNLRGTCIALEPFASARLFRRTTVDLTKRLPSKPFYGSEHNFHQYIRHLKFRPALLKPHDWTEQIRSKYASIIRMVLRAVPPNVLKRISTPSLLPVDAEVIDLIVLKQKELVELCLGPPKGSYLVAQSRLHHESKLATQVQYAAQSKFAAKSNPAAQCKVAAEPEPKPWPSTFQTLAIAGYIIGEQDFESFTEIIRKSQNLKKLEICCRAHTIRNDSFSPQTQNNNTTDRRSSKMLKFPNVTAKDGPKLDLQGVHLHHAHRTFTNYIRFDVLGSLALSNCAGAEGCLKTLTKLFHSKKTGSSLRSFSLLVAEKDETKPQSFNSDVLTAFLKTSKQLKDLNLDLWSVTALPDLKCLGSHAETLQKLFVSIRVSPRALNRRPHYDALPLDDLQYLCRTLVQLEQLAIILPASDMVMYFSQNLAEYQSYLEALASLPNLEILRIINWPIVLTDYFFKSGPGQMQLITKAFNKRMKRFAEMAVTKLTRAKRIHSAKLKLLIFGGNSSVCMITECRRFEQANARCYLIDTHSRDSARVVLRQVSARSVKYHHPDCSLWHRPVDDNLKEAKVDWKVFGDISRYRDWTLEEIVGP